MTTYSPRRLEASPFDWEALTEKQQAAVNSVARILRDSISAVDKRPAAGAEALDRNRRSQIAFIDGDRGMGKTSVLLTIMALTGETEQKIPSAGPVYELRERRNRLVWLETLDMEPLAKSSNLFAAIVARLSAVLDGPSNGSRPPIASALDNLDAHQQVENDLRALQDNAVRVWDGFLRGRSAHIDPTAFAAEVLQAETAMLKLKRSLADTLDKMAEVVADRYRAKNPIFVVPVDDFDLAPTRCLELLRLIRMVTTPRLFFLIAGNVRIAEGVLRLDSEGELSGLIHGNPPEQEWRQIKHLAVEIAANNLRKLVPPALRASLDTLNVQEALKLKTDPDAQPLGLILDAIRLGRNIAPVGAPQISLKEFFQLEKGASDYRYSGALWLCGTPRQVLDRVTMFSGLQGEQTNFGETLLRELAAELQRDAREDWRLEPEQRERVAEVFDTEERLQFDFHRVFKVVRNVERLGQVAFEHGTVTLATPHACTWYLRSTGGPEHSRLPADEVIGGVPRRLAAGLTLFHDLAISLGGWYVPSASVIYGADGDWAVPITYWGPVLQTPTAVRWHLPEWWPLREYERFGVCFSAYVRQLRNKSIEAVAEAWLASMMAILFDESPIPIGQKNSLKKILGLLARLSAEVPEREARVRLRQSALIVIGTFLAPESGVPASFAEQLLAVPSFNEALYAVEMTERIRRWRAIRYAETLRQEHPTEAVGAFRSAIAPKVAANDAIEHLRRFVELNPELKERITNSPLELLLKGGSYSSKIRQLVPTLRFLMLDNLHATYRPGEMVGYIKALEGIFQQHPINSFEKGALVPSGTDIEDARQNRVSRNNP